MLNHIAKEKPGAKVAFVYSDSEFGRDPIDSSEALAKKFGPVGGRQDHDACRQRGRVHRGHSPRRAAPDYTHLPRLHPRAPIPEFITQGKQQGSEEQVDGYVLDHGQLHGDEDGRVTFHGRDALPLLLRHRKAPMLEKIRQMRPEYQSTAYIQGFRAAMLFTESGCCYRRGQGSSNGRNPQGRAQQCIKDFDTGGWIGVPITISGNSIPVARVPRGHEGAKMDNL